MKQKKSVFIFFLFLIIVSCGKKNDLSSIFGQITEVHCKEIVIDDLLSNPSDLITIDGNIIFSDYVDDKIIAIYNIKEKKITHRIFTEGQGPNEFLPTPLTLEVDNKQKTINVLQRQYGIYTQYKLADLLNENIVPFNKFDFGRIDKITETHNGFIAAGSYSNGSIGIYDRNATLKNIEDIYPSYFSNSENIENKYRIGQGQIHFNKEMQIFVFGSSLTGEIKFFNVLNTYELKLIHSYSVGNSSFSNRMENNPDNTPIMETDIYHCVNICSSKECIYILYCGEQFMNRSSAKHSYILKFDSKGKALNCYKTDYQLISICVNDKEQVYGSSISEALDPVFVEIDM
ncbi:MAG: TolB-like 6-bladed beta-propeller domain-containing protein [Candidatus Symbiothrix sp.]|jgi:hypothetical protein|nr:TolB-like 6-bladed beta-propeller domain-containing protein [Candidatus Symbiothrix sp.]